MKKNKFAFMSALCLAVIVSAFSFSVISSAYDNTNQIISTNAELSSVYGDVNGDGNVTTADSIFVQRSVVGSVTFTDEQIKIADVDGNGKISVVDAILIQRYVVGMIDKFPIEEVATEPTEKPTEKPTQTSTERATDSEGWIEDVFKP